MELQRGALGLLSELTIGLPLGRDKGRVSACGANIGMTIPEILASGAWLEVDVLMSVPSTSTSAAFAKPTWTGYRSQLARASVQVNSLPAGLAFRIVCQFLAAGGIWPIAAAAVSYQGQLLFVAPLDSPSYCTPQTPFPLSITGIINGVIA
jgi:hypothetical protein